MTIHKFFVKPQAVNLSPETEEEEILQNVITICTTPKGSRPMDREFGINPFVVDAPMVREQARISAEIIAALKKYEPRAEVLSISIDWDAEQAQLWPRITIGIKDKK